MQRGTSELLPSKARCHNLGESDGVLSKNWVYMGLPGMGEPHGLLSMESRRVGHDQSDLAAAADKIRLFAGPQMVGLLVFRSAGPFNIVSHGFLAASPLISNCPNLPFGTQRRQWKLESCLQQMGHKKTSVSRSP